MRVIGGICVSEDYQEWFMMNIRSYPKANPKRGCLTSPITVDAKSFPHCLLYKRLSWIVFLEGKMSVWLDQEDGSHWELLNKNAP